MKAKYIPNILSSFRIVLALAFFFAMLILERGKNICILFLITAGITDVLDGFLARRFSWITDAGKILDPVADKTMQLAALAACIIKGLIPLWLLIPIAIKELIMGVGSLVYFKRAGAIGVSESYGKVYTVLFYVLIGSAVLFEGWLAHHNLAKTVLCLLVALSGLSAIVLYYITYLSKGKKR